MVIVCRGVRRKIRPRDCFSFVGDLDLIVGGSDGYNTHNDDYSRWATGALSYYENVGSATTPVFKEIQEGSRSAGSVGLHMV